MTLDRVNQTHPAFEDGEMSVGGDHIKMVGFGDQAFSGLDHL